MSAIQTMKNVQVSQNSIVTVAEALGLELKEKDNEITIGLGNNGYADVKFTKNEDGFFDVTYDSVDKEKVSRIIDSVIQEEVVREVTRVTNANIVDAVSYEDYVNGNANELVANLEY